jgi:hypothetical protein
MAVDIHLNLLSYQPLVPGGIAEASTFPPSLHLACVRASRGTAFMVLEATELLPNKKRESAPAKSSPELEECRRRLDKDCTTLSSGAPQKNSVNACLGV